MHGLEKYSFHLIGQYALSNIGHHLGYLLDTKKALENLGGKAELYVPINADANLPKACQRWFHSFRMGSRLQFFLDCLRLFKPRVDNRIFFVESFGRRDLRLFALACAYSARKKDSLWIIVRDDFTTRNPKDLNSIRSSMRLLSRTLKKRLVVLSDSQRLIDFYKEWFDQPIFLLPIFHAPYTARIYQRKERITCSWIGDPRAEKGSYVIAHLLQLKDAYSERFNIMLSEDANFPFPTNQLSITRLKKCLTRQEYDSAINQSDIVLLPYLAHRYRTRTSGIFVESILAGKMPVVTAETWMADQLQQYDLDELIIDWKDPYFFLTLYNLLNSTTIHQKLTRMQKAFYQFHSFENYQGILSQIFEYTLKKSH